MSERIERIERIEVDETKGARIEILDGTGLVLSVQAHPSGRGVVLRVIEGSLGRRRRYSTIALTHDECAALERGLESERRRAVPPAPATPAPTES